jgi:hypothetical protein
MGYDALVDAHVHAAERLDNRLESPEIDDGSRIKGDPAEISLDGQAEQLDPAFAALAILAAECERSIDLVATARPASLRPGRFIW